MTDLYIFDSSALLALLKGEKGSEIAKNYCGKILMSPINITEVVYVLQRSGVPNDLAFNTVKSIVAEISEIDLDDIKVAADIKNTSYKFGISTGDSFCLALGVNRKLPIITADKMWLKLKHIAVEVVCIR